MCLFTDAADAMRDVMRYIRSNDPMLPMFIISSEWNKTLQMLCYMKICLNEPSMLCYVCGQFRFMLFYVSCTYTDTKLQFVPNMTICIEDACSVLQTVRYLL